ncbi:acyl-CoA dehydrogenase [bacterium]|nr:acyl-CoA dehydrogenase [bacterium]
MEQPEHIELIELVERFLKSEITTDYLYARLEDEVTSDSTLWEEMRKIGFFEFFQELSKEDNPFSLLGNVQRQTGEYLLPESLVESLLTGPLFCSFLSNEDHNTALLDFLGEGSVDALRNGLKTVAIIPPSEQQLSVSKDGDTFFIDGIMNGVVRRSDCIGYLCCLEDSVYLFRESTDLSDLSPTKSLERMLPRGRYSVPKQKALPCKNISGQEWKAIIRFLVAAELLGIGERVLSMTRDFVSERRQFGVPVGCFQGVSHALANTYLQVRELEALIFFLGKMFDRGDRQRESVALVTLSAALERIPVVVEKCIQLHGGIGFTWEFPLHLFLRRACMYQSLYRLSHEEREEICSAASIMEHSSQETRCS